MSKDNPWASQDSQENTTIDPWGNTNVISVSDSLSAKDLELNEFTWQEPFTDTWIPIEEWIESGVGLLVQHGRPFFTRIKAPIDTTLSYTELALQAINPLLMIVIFGLLAWQLSSKRLAVGTMVSLFFIGVIGAWQEAMTTLALVMTSVLFCLIIGIPVGVLMAKSNLAERIVRPLLDAMQTTPAFVYLVPIVMLFGIGNVPGVIVTIIFSVAPVIRLTNLGIRQVPSDLIEAGRSFGASPLQLLFKVQLPLAGPTIMAGVNQTLMLSLSMVVIASMIAVDGLGLMVLRGIGRLDIGLAAVGGIGIVILAIILDRLTQSLGKTSRERGTRHWYDRGPISVFIITRRKPHVKS